MWSSALGEHVYILCILCFWNNFLNSKHYNSESLALDSNVQSTPYFWGLDCMFHAYFQPGPGGDRSGEESNAAGSWSVAGSRQMEHTECRHWGDLQNTGMKGRLCRRAFLGLFLPALLLTNYELMWLTLAHMCVRDQNIGALSSCYLI